MNVTFFSGGIHNVKDGIDLPMSEILDTIKNGDYKKQNEAVRKEVYHSDEQKKAKKKVPYYTPHCTCSARNTKSIKELSGFVMLDFDGLDPNNFKEEVCADPLVNHCYISVSSKGVVVGIKIATADIKAHFEQLRQYFIDTYGYTADKGQYEATRARYMSFDADIYINDKSITHEIKEEETGGIVAKMNEYTGAKRSNEERVKDTLRKLVRDAKDGEKHVQLRSAANLAGGYIAVNIIDELDAIELLEAEIRGRGNVKDIKQAIKTIKDGIENGKRNPVDIEEGNVVMLPSESAVWAQAYECNKAGLLDVGAFVDRLSDQFDIDREEVGAVFTKVYAENGEMHGYDSKSEREKLEIFLSLNFEFKRNVIGNRLEYRLKSWVDNSFQNLNSDTVYRYVDLKYSGKVGLDKIKSILRSDFVEDYDPFTEYFENSKYDGETDYIAELAGHIQLGDPSLGEFFATMLKKMLVRCVKCATSDYVNRYVFILSAQAQNIGKSYFVRYLNPWGMKYYSEQPLRDNKDTELSFNRNFIHNLEELQGIGRKDLGRLKAQISKFSIQERKAYAEDADEFVRRVNFFGSTNDTMFLVDDQNTRFLVFEVEKFNFDYSKNVNINNVWAQAFYLLEQGYDCELDQEESKKRDEVNEIHERDTLEVELLSKWFEPYAESDGGAFYSASEIVKKIEYEEAGAFKLNRWEIVRALRKFGFDNNRGKVKNVGGTRKRGYWARLINNIESNTGVTRPQTLRSVV